MLINGTQVVIVTDEAEIQSVNQATTLAVTRVAKGSEVSQPQLNTLYNFTSFVTWNSSFIGNHSIAILDASNDLQVWDNESKLNIQIISNIEKIEE